MQIKCYPNGLFMVNTYLIINVDTSEGLIIDPGSDIEHFIADIKKSKINIKAVVCTHGHIDHIQGVDRVKQEFNVPLLLNENEKSVIDHTNHFAALFGIEAPPIPTIDKNLPGEGTIDLAGFTITLLHTPGHSPGSISLLINDNLFSGDVLFDNSIGRTDLPGGNHNQLVASIREKLYTLPDDVQVYPGHGPQTTISKEKNTNPFV